MKKLLIRIKLKYYNLNSQYIDKNDENMNQKGLPMNHKYNTEISFISTLPK